MPTYEGDVEVRGAGMTTCITADGIFINGVRLPKKFNKGKIVTTSKGTFVDGVALEKVLAKSKSKTKKTKTKKMKTKKTRKTT